MRSLNRRPPAVVAKLEQMAARIDETVRAVRRLSANSGRAFWTTWG
jgi:hypothetical protein